VTLNHDSLFPAKNSLVSVLKNKTTCGKETTRLNQNYVWTSADRAGRQVTLLIPPFLLVFLGITAEGRLDGRKVLPQIIVLFSLFKVHANKKALVQKEKSKVLLSCKVHKKTCKHLRKTSWILVENSVWRNRRLSETSFFFGGEGHRFKSVAPQNKYATRMELIKCHTYATLSHALQKTSLFQSQT